VSFEALAWVKKTHVDTPGRKLLLMVLAEYAAPHEVEAPGADGRHFCWPGERLLAADCSMSERTVRRHLAELAEARLIERVQRGGDGSGRRSDLIILACDSDGSRPFPVDNPVDEDVDKATGQSDRLGATGQSMQGNRTNEVSAPYIGTSKGTAKPNTRGTRLPENFEVTKQMRSWYRENIGGAVDGVLEHEKFLDYWRSRTGQIASKKDWPAAWRNWMREAMQRSGRRASSPAGSSKPKFPTAQERSQMQREHFQELAVRAEKWVEEHGGNPDDHKQVLAVMERMKAEAANGSASRTPGMYSEGEVIDGTIVPPKEVTAGEGQ
jgi:DNA-binding transcriptional ArsR family regulator